MIFDQRWCVRNRDKRSQKVRTETDDRLRGENKQQRSDPLREKPNNKATLYGRTPNKEEVQPASIKPNRETP